MERILFLDTLKGFGIAFIVLGHIIGAGCHLSHGATQAFCEAGYKYLYAFHVPLFFFLAGITYKVVPWKMFFNKKFYRLVLPYLFWGVISILLYAMIEVIIDALLKGDATTSYYENKTNAISMGQQFLNFLLGGFWENGFVANSVLWFVPVLFTLEVFAQGIGRGIKDRWQWLALGLVCALLWFYFAKRLILLPFGIWGIAQYTLWFVLGMLFPKHIAQNVQKISWGYILPVLIALVYVTVLNPWQYFPRTLWQYMLNACLIGANIFVWFVLSSKITCRLLTMLGGCSLAIMFMHKFPVLFFQNIVPQIKVLFTTSVIATILGTILVFSLSILCCFISIWFFRRCLPWAIGESTSKKTPSFR